MAKKQKKEEDFCMDCGESTGLSEHNSLWIRGDGPFCQACYDYALRMDAGMSWVSDDEDSDTE